MGYPDPANVNRVPTGYKKQYQATAPQPQPSQTPPAQSGGLSGLIRGLTSLAQGAQRFSEALMGSKPYANQPTQFAPQAAPQSPGQAFGQFFGGLMQIFNPSFINFALTGFVNLLQEIGNQMGQASEQFQAGTSNNTPAPSQQPSAGSTAPNPTSKTGQTETAAAKQAEAKKLETAKRQITKLDQEKFELKAEDVKGYLAGLEVFTEANKNRAKKIFSEDLNDGEVLDDNQVEQFAEYLGFTDVYPAGEQEMEAAYLQRLEATLNKHEELFKASKLEGAATKIQVLKAQVRQGIFIQSNRDIEAIYQKDFMNNYLNNLLNGKHTSLDTIPLDGPEGLKHGYAKHFEKSQELSKAIETNNTYKPEGYNAENPINTGDLVTRLTDFCRKLADGIKEKEAVAQPVKVDEQNKVVSVAVRQADGAPASTEESVTSDVDLAKKDSQENNNNLR